MEGLTLGGGLGGLMGLEKLLQPLGVVHRRGLAGRRLAGPVETGIDGDAVKPGRHRGLPPERMGGPEGGDKGILHGVGGFLPVPQRAQGHRPEPIAVAPHELAEGVRITSDVPGQQILVADVAEPVVLHRRLPSPATANTTGDVRWPPAGVSPGR